MKHNNSGDYFLLYVEPSDDRASLFNAISGQQKPVVMLIKEHTRVLQRPEDFAALKHLKRQSTVPIVLVIENSAHLAQLASRHGFSVYSSMDALSDALAHGLLGRQRALNRATAPLGAPELPASPRKTVPLAPPLEQIEPVKIAPLLELPKKPSSTHNAMSPQGIAQPDPVLSASPKTPPERQNTFSPQPAVPTASKHARLDELPTRPQPRKAAPAKARQPRLPLGMLVLTFIALALAGLGSVLVFFNKLPSQGAVAAPAPVGHVAFLNSEQISENSSQGIDDQVLVDLTNLPRPAQGKSYYAWLLGDKSQSDLKVISLGALQLNNGHTHLLYPGDAQHTNLLLVTSRFLVTEEDATMAPISPSPDMSTWRYYGEFAQNAGDPEDPQHYTYLDHLRHLLAADPALDDLELTGGLNTWFYRNTGKILEWSSSMREQWEEAKDAGFVRRMAIRTLTYLDGLAFVQQDLPPKTPLLVNERLARVGLIDMAGPNQDPACYLSHIDRHLNGLLRTGSPSPDLRKQVGDLMIALNNARYWLNQVHHDASTLMKMSDQQLKAAATLNIINDMIDNANHAYTGQTDPDTGQIRQGAVWIHEHLQDLAALSVTTFTANGSALELIPDLKHIKALH